MSSTVPIHLCTNVSEERGNGTGEGTQALSLLTSDTLVLWSVFFRDPPKSEGGFPAQEMISVYYNR